MNQLYSYDNIKDLGIHGFLNSTLISHRLPIELDNEILYLSEPKRVWIEKALKVNAVLCSDLFGYDPKVSDETDLENVIENLLRLETLVTASNGNFVIRKETRAQDIGDGDTYFVFVDMELAGRYDHAGKEDQLVYLSGPKSSNEFHHDYEDKWWKSLTLSKYTGRKINTVGYMTQEDDPSDSEDLYLYLTKIYTDGIRNVFVKTAQSKTLAKKIELTKDIICDQVMKNKLGMHGDPYDLYMGHLEGRPEAYIVQEWIPMKYEYRFIVVNDEIITGAGSIQEFTPINRDSSFLIDGKFDTRIREDRWNESSPIESNFEIVESYIDTVSSLLEDYIKERNANDQSPFYGTIDLAMTDNGSGDFVVPVLVETNGLSNAGYFSSDIESVSRKIISDSTVGEYDINVDLDFRNKFSIHQILIGTMNGDVSESHRTSIGIHIEEDEENYDENEES